MTCKIWGLFRIFFSSPFLFFNEKSLFTEIAFRFNDITKSPGSLLSCLELRPPCHNDGEVYYFYFMLGCLFSALGFLNIISIPATCISTIFYYCLNAYVPCLLMSHYNNLIIITCFIFFFSPPITKYSIDSKIYSLLKKRKYPQFKFSTYTAGLLFLIKWNFVRIYFSAGLTKVLTIGSDFFNGFFSKSHGVK